MDVRAHNFEEALSDFTDKLQAAHGTVRFTSLLTWSSRA
jgi:hypothetical protein